jgi:hypothetical protein
MISATEAAGGVCRLENRRSMFDKINLMIKTEGIDSNLLLSRLAVVAIRVQNLVEARIGME